MNRLLVFFLLSFLFKVNLGYSQFTEIINSNRPGNSSGAFAVGKNILQFENGFYVKQNNWINRMYDDPSFVEKVKSRYSFYFDKLNEFKKEIDDISYYINKSQEANYQRWGTLGVYVWPNPVWNLTYSEEVDRLKDWIENRMNWLNANF